jgi:hypothetical protein
MYLITSNTGASRAKNIDPKLIGIIVGVVAFIIIISVLAVIFLCKCRVENRLAIHGQKTELDYIPTAVDVNPQNEQAFDATSRYSTTMASRFQTTQPKRPNAYRNDGESSETSQSYADR